MKIKKLSYLPILMTLVLMGCSEKDDRPSTNTTPAKVFEIDLSTQHQTIAGFGGANRMWTTQYLTGSAAEKAFSTGEEGLGLSIFRDRIAPNSSDWAQMVSSLQAAQNHGVKILASPWSPPANLKNNTDLVGGYLLASNYSAYKDHLNDYIAYMATNGITINAVSIQNEPDIQVSYESCDWTATTMSDFISQEGAAINARVVAPECFQFDQGFTNTLLNNPNVLANLDVVGGHIYGGGLGMFPLAEQNNKEIWMTEYLLNLGTGGSGAPAWSTYSEEAKWNETMTMLGTIHSAMENNWNAYIWWYIQRYYSFIGDGTEGTTSGEILKRGYAFSHFSKYVRPGYVRVNANAQSSSNLKVTAFDGGDKIVVVVINDGGNPVSRVQFEVPEVSSVSAYETTLAKDRALKAVTIEEGSKVELSVILASSITTVVINK